MKNSQYIYRPQVAKTVYEFTELHH